MVAIETGANSHKQSSVTRWHHQLLREVACHGGSLRQASFTEAVDVMLDLGGILKIEKMVPGETA